MNNLLQRVSVYHCHTYPKGSAEPVTVINQNNYNVLSWQPLLAGEMFWVEHFPWDYGVELHQKGNNIEVAFQPLPSADIMASVKVVHDEPDQVPLKEASQEPCLPHIWTPSQH